MINTARPARPRLPLWRRLSRGELLPALLFISPWIVGFCWFQLYPIASSIYYSFTDFSMMQPPVQIGLSNYQNLFQNDDLFHTALKNTAVFCLFSVPIDLAIAFLFAVLLNMNIPGRAIFRTLFYFPNVVPAVASSILWIMLLNVQGGLVNTGLGLFGISPVPWLASPDWAMPTLVLISVWGIGGAVVIFLAGLQDVPRQLYEAAQIDGAGPLNMVRNITIPMMSPVILFNLVIGMIGAFQVFTLPFIVFGGGGPLNAVLMYSVQLYTVAFKDFRMGYASAMAWILFVIIFVLTMVSMRISNRFVHYE